MSATGIEIPIISTYKDKGAKAASKSLDILTKSAKTLGIALGAYQTLKFGKSSVRAFADDAKAANQLSKTLANLGQSYAVVGTAGFIQNLQNTTGVLDDQLRPAFTTLVNATLDAKKAQDLLSVALDTSAGTTSDLQSVTDALAKAALGQNTAIGKLGIGLTQAELKTMDLDKITKYLSQRFNGQAKLAAESFAGKMDILKAKTEDAKEMIGGELVAALDAAFGDPDKYGSAIDTIGLKVSNLIKGFSKFITLTKTGLQNPLLSPKSAQFESKANLKIPFNTVSRFVDAKAYKEQLKLQEEAKKLAASRLAAIAKEKALVAQQKKLEEDRKKLEKFSTVLDLDQIQIYAALQNKVTDQEKLRLSLQMALLQGNASEAQKLATELVKSQLLTTNLAEAINKLPKGLYPFEGWSKDIDLLIQQILLMMRLLSAMPTKPLGQPMTGTPTYYTDLAKTLVNTTGYLGMSESQIAEERRQESGGRYGGMQTAPVTVINVNGATEGLLNELRNGLINSSASGSFSSVSPFR
jgi:hypothetical protein